MGLCIRPYLHPVKVPPMPDLHRLLYRRAVRPDLPDGVDVGSVQVSCAVPAPTPHCKRKERKRRRSASFQQEVWCAGILTVFGPRSEIDRLALLVREQSVVGTEPRAVLRIRARVVGEPAEADVPSY